ncbi:MAG: hypothetical protein JXR73_21175 [Candidatus Omnitrophica bacterium]|nr:hypothetical protein [Candidatus Omnitrophota bacterium]
MLLPAWLTLPAVIAQERPLGFKPYETSDFDLTVFIYFLGGLILSIFLFSFGNAQYHRWKKYKEFEAEMKSLDLDPGQEKAMSDMAKRRSLDEPAHLLMSVRLFDEMASEEIKRILRSPASAKFKQAYIDKIYRIRTKTYHPEWLDSQFHTPNQLAPVEIPPKRASKK